MKGKFVMIDGIDGSGKGVILGAIKDQYEQVYDLREYTKENNSFPRIDEIKQEISAIKSPSVEILDIGDVLKF